MPTTSYLDRIGIIFDNSPELLIFISAIHKIGAIAVIINNEISGNIIKNI